MFGSFVAKTGKTYWIDDGDQMSRYGFHLNLTKVELSDRKKIRKKVNETKSVGYEIY